MTNWETCDILNRGDSMFFQNDDISFNLIFVGEMRWPAGHHAVKARPLDALTFRRKGRGTITVGNTVYEIKEDDLLFLPRNLAYVADYEETEIVYFHFVAEEEYSAPEVFTPRNPAVFRALLSACVADWDVTAPGYQLRSKAHLMELLSEIFRQGSVADGRFPPAAQTALRFLQEGYRDPQVNISAVCAAAGISEGYFRRIFRCQFGIPPIEYLTNLRLDYARKLLSGGTVSVEQTALASGFSDVKYFSRVVKKIYGCTPSQLILR